jgi:hypothetical protein
MSDNRKPDKPGKGKEPARPTASVSPMTCPFANQYAVLTISEGPFHTRVQARSYYPYSSQPIRVAFGSSYVLFRKPSNVLVCESTHVLTTSKDVHICQQARSSCAQPPFYLRLACLSLPQPHLASSNANAEREW